MRISVELVGARQEWRVDSDQHINRLVLRYAGKEFTVDVTEQEMRRIIATATKEQQSAPYEGPTDQELLTQPVDTTGYEDLEEVIYDATGDEIFGGDPAESPVAHQSPVFETEELEPEEHTGPRQDPARVRPMEAWRQRHAELRANRPDMQRKARLQALRERAAKRPPKRVPLDEVGNPKVAPTEPVITEPDAEIPDDDVFAQG